MKRKLFPLIVVIFVLPFLIGGIVLAEEAEDWMRGRDPDKFGGTLTLARGWEPTTLDSLLTNYGDQAHLYLSEPPFMYSPDGEFGPSGWVKSATQSEDNLTWRFELKKGVTFHDGKPLDAEAFAWLLRKRIRDDSVYSYPLTNVPDPEHIVVVDDYTLEIRQEEKAFPELAFTMATPSWLGAMRTPKAVEEYGDDY
ncbi:MAG: ABC transporter substrate-binding protein, partial [Halanaerobiales bacterium]